jgi:hypothetical protein
MDTSGHRLWEDSTSASAIWPLVVMGPDGSRLAQETLAVNHAVNASAPVDREDVKGQLVRVFNAADGKVAPSGRRVAVLNAGAIQVFDLPAPPPLADTAGNQTAH